MHTQNVVKHFLYLSVYFYYKCRGDTILVAIISLEKIELNYVFIYD